MHAANAPGAAHCGALSFLGVLMLSVTDNIADVLRWTDRLSSQYQFAVAVALTETARTVAQSMPAQVEKAFEGGVVPFTRQAFYLQRADKTRLTSVIGIKRLQAEYLRWQVYGGERRPKRLALRLPAVVNLTPQGNLPAGTIRRLVARAQAGKRATKGMAKRYGVSADLDLFYGDPEDGRPAGIYKRVGLVSGQQRLVPVVQFPQTPARYRPTFEFHRIARDGALTAFKPALLRAWARAKATAR